MADEQSFQPLLPYSGALDSIQAASAIQAARLNSVELTDSAELLFNLKRFPHSVLLATLAIEEAAKPALLLTILLGFDPARRATQWKSYRKHQAKTAILNTAIRARIRAVFPNVSPAEADEIAALGPTPAQLESWKQLAVYSDCIASADSMECHLPRNMDWRQRAWERLCEAQALASGLRDYTPKELELWLAHAMSAHAAGRDMKEMLPALHADLVKNGFVREGSWITLLSDLREESASDGGA